MNAAQQLVEKMTQNIYSATGELLLQVKKLKRPYRQKHYPQIFSEEGIFPISGFKPLINFTAHLFTV